MSPAFASTWENSFSKKPECAEVLRTTTQETRVAVRMMAHEPCCSKAPGTHQRRKSKHVSSAVQCFGYHRVGFCQTSFRIVACRNTTPEDATQHRDTLTANRMVPIVPLPIQTNSVCHQLETLCRQCPWTSLNGLYTENPQGRHKNLNL